MHLVCFYFSIGIVIYFFDVYEYLLGLIIVCTLDELKFDCGHKFKSYSI